MTFNRQEADTDDFEFARDRIMMGIERKSLSMSEKDRLATAIHESGHSVACYFNKHAQKLYKATIVARGGSLGAVSTIARFSNYVDLHGSRRVSADQYEQSPNSRSDRCCYGRTRR